jgi:hypothetical protein
MSTKHRVATFNILVVLALAATLATIAVESASAQNSTNEQQSSNIGSNQPINFACSHCGRIIDEKVHVDCRNAEFFLSTTTAT